MNRLVNRPLAVLKALLAGWFLSLGGEHTAASTNAATLSGKDFVTARTGLRDGFLRLSIGHELPRCARHDRYGPLDC